MTNEAVRELAVVTGGAVRVGKEIALTLASAGYAVGLHYHSSRPEAEKTAQEIEEHGAPVFLLQADLTDQAEIDDCFAKISALPFALSVLVNSAAVMPHGDLRSLSVVEWDDTLNLNLRAPWLTSKAAAGLMEERGGVIINISDTGAGKVWTGFPAYTISKAGLEVLTKLLARTLAPKIRVNAIAPGLVLSSADTSSEEWQRLVNRLPVKHAGTPAAVAEAVLFLIENRYITGEIVHVDGGYQLI